MLAFPKGPLLTAHPSGVVSFKHFLLVGVPPKQMKFLLKGFARKKSQKGEMEGRMDSQAGCHDIESGYTGVLWRQCGLASEWSPSGARSPEHECPSTCHHCWERNAFQVLLVLVFTGKIGSGNLRATSDKESQRTCQELM